MIIAFVPFSFHFCLYFNTSISSLNDHIFYLNVQAEIVRVLTKEKESLILSGHTGYVQGVAWDPLGEMVVTQSADRTCKMHMVTDKLYMMMISHEIMIKIMNLEMYMRVIKKVKKKLNCSIISYCFSSLIPS